MDSKIAIIHKSANKLAQDARDLSDQVQLLADSCHTAVGVDPLIYGLTIFILSCFVGYYVVWKVTPSLHTPLMSLTNAVSGIILVGAMIAVGPKNFDLPQFTGFIAVILASINIFGGFIVTHNMLKMFRKK